jgi:hypothetical protein
MGGPQEQKIVDIVSAIPFASVFGYNFMTLNELLETATLTIGLLSGVFALFFHIRRWYRGKKREKLTKL